MTAIANSETESTPARSLNGTGIARACCALVALLMVAAIVYGGVLVLENYGQIAV